MGYFLYRIFRRITRDFFTQKAPKNHGCVFYEDARYVRILAATERTLSMHGILEITRPKGISAGTTASLHRSLDRIRNLSVTQLHRASWPILIFNVYLK